LNREQLLQYLEGFPTNADKLVALVKKTKGFTLFKSPQGEAYAKVTLRGHLEIRSVSTRSRMFKRWLLYAWDTQVGGHPGEKALQHAVELLESEALHAAKATEDIYVRVAAVDEDNEKVIYVDLCNAERQVIRITKDGWEKRDTCIINFWRPESKLPLPDPQRGGSLKLLRSFFNLDKSEHEATWVELAACLLGAFQPYGAYTVTAIHGEQGSHKSTFLKAYVRLVDPMNPLHRHQPKEDVTVMIAAKNSHLLAYDNLSYIPQWLSDLFCEIATGAGMSNRKYFVNDEEVLFEARRPVIYTGIEEVARQSDLLDRCMVISLPSADPTSQKPDEDVEAEFQAIYPQVLGALYDAVSTALKRLSDISKDGLSRMASFDLWAQAGEPAFGCAPGTFKTVYRQNKENASASVLDSSLIATLIDRFIMQQKVEGSIHTWMGKATDLLEELRDLTDEQKRKTLPADGKALSNKLNGLAPNLRAVKSIDIQTGKWRNKQRNVIITKPVATQNNDDFNANNDDKNASLSPKSALQAAHNNGNVNNDTFSLSFTSSLKNNSEQELHGEAEEDMLAEISGANSEVAENGTLLTLSSSQAASNGALTDNDEKNHNVVAETTSLFDDLMHDPDFLIAAKRAQTEHDRRAH
jgi:hypothetical protein